LKIVFYDTETTGLSDKDEVIQLSGLVTDMDLKIQSVFNTYCFTNVNISEEARRLHGIDRKTLLQLSKGRYLEEVLESIGVFKYPDAIYVAFNDSFDRGKINGSLMNNGAPPINFGSTISTFDRKLQKGRYNLCALKLFSNCLNNGTRWKLEMFLRKKAGVPFEDLERYYSVFRNKVNITSHKGNMHDALFDSFGIWWITSKYKGILFT
jgi:DNA polymerase III epsilon subunit-like protein